MKQPDFILAGLTSWAPLDDRPNLQGDYRWFLEDWTGPLPPKELFCEAWKQEIESWPRSLTEQRSLARKGPSLVLVSGDPLIATPHHLLLDQLRQEGLNCMVRRRPGIVDLLAQRIGRRPRLLPASATQSIHHHLEARQDPLLVVEDDQGHDLWDLAATWSESGWKLDCMRGLGGPEEWCGDLASAPHGGPRCLLLSCP